MVTFEEFSRANLARCESPQGFNFELESWSVSDWMLAVFGELGEASNVRKKLNRSRDGARGNRQSDDELRDKFRREIGDTLVYLDLLAQYQGFDLLGAALEVFDLKSEEIGYPVRLKDGRGPVEEAHERIPAHDDVIRLDERAAVIEEVEAAVRRCHSLDEDGRVVSLKKVIVAIRSLADPGATTGVGKTDDKRKLDRYGIALMMIREGCEDPRGLAKKILHEESGNRDAPTIGDVAGVLKNLRALVDAMRQTANNISPTHGNYPASEILRWAADIEATLAAFVQKKPPPSPRPAPSVPFSMG